MASMTNQQPFRKGALTTHSKNPYQDPTYLSFVIVFDRVNSPLLNKGISAAFLRDFYKDETRAGYLEDFIDTLLLLNSEMPWYWKSLSGVDRAISVYENFGESYHGGDDAILEITCMESINLAISGLMDLYRQAVYDSAKWTQVLPENLRKFKMQVFVSEVRDHRKTTEINPTAEKTINSDFDFCEFKAQSASEAFADLSTTEPEITDDLKLSISYEKVRIITNETSYLNGLVLPSGTSESAVELSLSETQNPLQAFGDRIAQEGQEILQSTKNALGNSIKQKNPANLLYKPGNVYGSFGDQAFDRLVNAADQAAGSITRIPENLYRQAVTSVTEGGEGFKRSISTNIFGTKVGEPISNALRRGAIQSIFPMINTQRSNLPPGTNIFE